MSGVDAFVGSWREEEKIGYDELANVLGLDEQKKEFFKNARTEITYVKKDGDNWQITVGMQGVPQNQTFQLTLGNEYQSASLDGSQLASVMKADGDKFVETHVHKDANIGDMHITRHIENDKMVVKTEVGANSMTSKYIRI